MARQEILVRGDGEDKGCINRVRVGLVKEVENGSGLVELGCFVVIFEGYKARPIVKKV